MEEQLHGGRMHTFRKHLVQMTAGSGVSLLSRVLVGFLLPLIMGVTEYGYYKTYALYASYAALFHFGFVDGILLKFAGTDYRELNPPEMRSYTQFFFVFQLAMSAALLCVIGGTAPSSRWIGILLCVNMVLINMTTYYQFIAQATQRFGELSAQHIISAVLQLMLVAGCGLAYRRTQQPVSCRFYLIGVTAIAAGVTGWYGWTYRSITFGPAMHTSTVRRNIRSLFRSGIALTVAYQTANLVLLLDRQFVSVLYDIDTYSYYAFAYGIAAVFTTLISAVATVLFPALKRQPDRAMARFSDSAEWVGLAASLVLIGYYPIGRLVEVCLADYAASVGYLRIILPGLLPLSVISAVFFTYCKALGEIRAYFRCACAALLTGAVANCAAQLIFHTPAAISAASVVTAAVWYAITAAHFVRTYHVSLRHGSLFLLAAMGSFYVISGLKLHWLAAMLLQTAAVLLPAAVLHRKRIRQIRIPDKTEPPPLP